MSGKSRLIANLNALMREDSYVLNLCESMGLELDSIEALLEKIYNNFWFDSIDEDLGIPFMSSIMDLSLDSDLTLEEKRSIISAKWKNKGKTTEEFLQMICDSWRNGTTVVNYEDSNLEIKFTGIGGVPSDLDSLKDEINKAKPAYLLVDYVFSYLYWDLFDSFELTWDEFEAVNKTFDEWEITIKKP
jgi:hypothetical protein